MKFFAAVLVLASLVAAAPIVDIEARAGPGKAVTTTATTSSAAPTATKDCWNNGCGGGGNYPWKREDEALEARAEDIEARAEDLEVRAEDLEARAGPGKAVTTTTASTSSAAPTATKDCWNNGCGGGGNYPW